MVIGRGSIQKQLGDLAVEALRRCHGDLEEARKDMRDLLFARKQMLNDLIDAVVEAAVDNAVRYAHRGDNAAIVAHVAKQQTTVEEDVREAAQSAARVLLLEVVLGDGTKLRAARRPQLLSEATFHGKQSQTMYMKALFYKAVAASLPDDKIVVEKVLTEEQLRGIFKRAQTCAKTADIFGSVPGALTTARS